MPTNRKAAVKTVIIRVCKTCQGSPCICEANRIRNGIKQKSAVSIVPRLKAGTYLAIDMDGDPTFFRAKPRPGVTMWLGECIGYGNVFVRLPRIPKSRWDKHLYRVGKNGELVRVDIS